MPTEPAPIRVEASGNFSGDDGAWSAVKIRAGSPPQNLEVYPSTEFGETWVVQDAACFGFPSNCTGLRGGTFNTSKSTSWAPKATYELGEERNLGIATDNGPDADIGLFGFDTLGLQVLGGDNISLSQQVVVGINTTHFVRGNLGLALRSIIFGDTTTSPSFLQSLKDSKLIPSLSYGYTAGASYRKSNASLTLGGRDASRFTPNDVTFTLAPTDVRELVVGLHSIVSVDSTGNETTLLSDGILTLVDSTVPHIWLPLEACQAFEAAFGINYDPISNLYLINDTLHDTLQKQNTSVTFELSNDGGTGPSINITLPYASFDLEVQAGYALVTKTQKYFPLRRAHDDSQYTLGRTFLQESFLTVNYETKNFSISQAIAAPDSASHIVAMSIDNTTEPTSTNPPPFVETQSPKSHLLSTGAKAGIAVAAIILIALIVGGVLFCFRQKKRRDRKSGFELPGNQPARTHSTLDTAELEGDRGDGGDGYSGMTMVKGAGSNDDEKENERIYRGEVGLMNDERLELVGSDVLRPEMPSPDLRHELPSPPPRSELSTPEPIWPEMAAEMTGRNSGREPSRSQEDIPSPLSSRNQMGSQKKPRPSLRHHSRVISSDSEGGLTRDGIAGFSTHHRVDSSDSEISALHSNGPSNRPLNNRTASSDSEPISPENPTNHAIISRPSHHRVDSGDSIATRMSPTSPTRPAHHQQVQAIPSIGPENPLSAFSSPVMLSRSGQMSPEPMEIDEIEPVDSPKRH